MVQNLVPLYLDKSTGNYVATKSSLSVGGSLNINADNSTLEIVSDVLQVKNYGIINTKLANSSIIISDGVASDAVALGETFTITGGTLTSTSVALNEIIIDVALNLNDVSDVSAATPIVGNALVWDGSSWSPSNISGGLANVTGAATAAGQILISDGTNYTPKQIQYIDNINVANTTWIVSHNLGQKYVNVTVYDSSDAVIIPESITATDANTTTITFNTAITGTAVVMGIADVAVV